MNSEDLKQLGQKLIMIRESKNLSLDQIASITKINVNFLRKFEQGMFDFLPEFYSRNFLKLYLQHLGKEAQKLLEEYDKIFSSDSKIETADEISNTIINQESRFQFVSNFFKPIMIHLSRNN